MCVYDGGVSECLCSIMAFPLTLPRAGRHDHFNAQQPKPAITEASEKMEKIQAIYSNNFIMRQTVCKLVSCGQ